MNRCSLSVVAAITMGMALTLTACRGSDDTSSKSTPKAASLKAIQNSVSKEVHAAIKAATPKAVYPKDEFGKTSSTECANKQSSVRIAGWDPDETQANEDLLAKSTTYLEKHGWSIFTVTTGSDDQAA